MLTALHVVCGVLGGNQCRASILHKQHKQNLWKPQCLGGLGAFSVERAKQQLNSFAPRDGRTPPGHLGSVAILGLVLCVIDASYRGLLEFLGERVVFRNFVPTPYLLGPSPAHALRVPGAALEDAPCFLLWS